MPSPTRGGKLLWGKEIHVLVWGCPHTGTVMLQATEYGIIPIVALKGSIDYIVMAKGTAQL